MTTDTKALSANQLEEINDQLNAIHDNTCTLIGDPMPKMNTTAFEGLPEGTTKEDALVFANDMVEHAEEMASAAYWYQQEAEALLDMADSMEDEEDDEDY